MSEAIEPSLFHRMRYTPLRDALRGRLTARLDYLRRIEAARLPAPAKDLIRGVVKRTRLSRIEKADLADELIAHFADGIDAGETAESLMRSFGDPHAAARLLRRAMKRKRSVPWKTFAALRWLCAALLALYAICAVLFFLGKPSVKVNYVAAMNRELKRYPIDQHGWPLYRKAIPRLNPKKTHDPDTNTFLLESTPASPRWGEMIAWLNERREAIALARRAAAKPTLGFVFGPGGSAYDAELFPGHPAPDPQHGYPMMLSVLLPHLNEMRNIANVLAADARVARQEADAARLIANIDAIFGIADQLTGESFLIQQFVAVGIRHVALEQIAQTLEERPELLQTEALQRLAHRLAMPATAAELLSLAHERATFYDLVQRMYTDDGNGDGRLTREGLKILGQIARPSKDDGLHLREASALASPLLLPSRREMIERYDRWMDRATQALSRPAREVNTAWSNEEVGKLQSSTANRVRYDLLLHTLPSVSGLNDMAERYLGKRDGVLVAIAAEVYRRQHDGQWPQTLEALTPALLPAVSVDRITGAPLRYRIVDGRPLVYSVGADRDDDAGRPPRDKSGEANPALAARWNFTPERAPDGDWVVYGQ